MTAENPLVSIIMPVYNREQFVKKSIDSVLAQTYRSWEFLVVDDGSTDRTREILKSYGHKLSVFEQANQGPYVARNLALRQVKGDLIAFIDSDDVWVPNKLSEQIPYFRNPAVGLVFGNGIFMHLQSGTVRRLPLTQFAVSKPHRGRVMPFLSRMNFIPQSSVVVRKTCFDEAGPFSLTGPLGSDYAKWFQISMRHELDYVDRPLMECWLHGGNISRRPIVALQSQIKLFEELHGTAPDAYAKQFICRKLFDLRVNLIRASMKQGWGAFSNALNYPASVRCPRTLYQTLSWFMISIFDQLRLGVKLIAQRAGRTMGRKH